MVWFENRDYLSHSVAQAGLEPTEIPLPPPLQALGLKVCSPELFYRVLRFRLPFLFLSPPPLLLLDSSSSNTSCLSSPFSSTFFSFLNLPPCLLNSSSSPSPQLFLLLDTSYFSSSSSSSWTPRLLVFLPWPPGVIPMFRCFPENKKRPEEADSGPSRPSTS